ncbi:hypothetical protein TDMWS_21640 [Thermodesulfomicrobium sp. WS]|uniref:tetratricopeptide repeat protein n=1 Tax=Thermodesulfomicrobium sp. WS TaxID=3004129 RepID=UPI0024915487|nr:tetratricopeptide repeat protein [Thermodesulfomicrobium sp. WS]BDV02079.1 hypothetical protein TDMWS_21640 [Thermodesulfomicrobium sp. WS]
MSLIYESLKKNAAAPQPPPLAPVHAPRRMVPLRVLRRIAVGVGILAACVGAGWALVSWVQGEVERLGPRLQATRAIEPVPAPTPPAEPPAPPAPQAPQALQPQTPPTPPPAPVRTKIGIEDLARPTLELEQVFSQRARHNQRVLELSGQLATAWNHKDLPQVRRLVAGLRTTAGATSPLVRRWEGILALHDGQTAIAEARFRALVAEGHGDRTTRLYLAQILLSQNKRLEAQAELSRLAAEFPEDPDIARLTARLKGEKAP